MKSDQLQLIGYTDSDYAGCIDNKKSTSGYIFLLQEDGGFSREAITTTLLTIRVIELYCNSDKSLVKLKHIDIKFLVNNGKVQNHIVSVDSVGTIF